MAEPSSIYFTMREEPSSTNSSIFARISSVQSSGRRSILRNPFGRTNYQRSSSVYSRPIDFNFDFDLENAPPVPPVPTMAALNARHQQQQQQQEESSANTTPRLGFSTFFARREEEPLPPCPPMMTDFAAQHRRANHSRQVSPLIGTTSSNTSSPSGLSTEWRAPSPVQPKWASPIPEVLEDTRPVILTRSISSDRVPLTATTRLTDETLTDEREERRKQRRKRRRHHHATREAWVRPHRRGTGTGHREFFLHRGPSREKNIYVTSVVAGLFLLATIATYVTIALTVKGLGQELHILFSITIVAICLFLIHALITLRSNIKKRGSSPRRMRRDLQGYKPSEPIQVHMGADEASIEKIDSVKPPPPAYGLWRSSVRVNPQLLFWQKVPGASNPNGPIAPVNNNVQDATRQALNASTTAAGAGTRRPPSYASDDGVSYIVDAVPRSTVQMPSVHPPMDQHPAFRF